MKSAMTLLLAAAALSFGFTVALAVRTQAAKPAVATASGFALAQAMVPPTGMMDAEHPMPMNERYLKRFPQPVLVGDRFACTRLKRFHAGLRPAGRAHAAGQNRPYRLV
jgi:hypothetical protein